MDCSYRRNWVQKSNLKGRMEFIKGLGSTAHMAHVQKKKEKNEFYENHVAVSMFNFEMRGF